MKKLLIGTSALVAAGLLAAAPAQAQERISLQLGGFMKWYAGYASQKSDFEKAQADTNGRYYNKVDLFQDTEVHFRGSTTLDNGLTIGVLVQLEGERGEGSRVIDKSYMTLSGGFGRFIIGNENNGARLLHVGAPAVGLGLEGSDSMGAWIVAPANMNTQVRTAIDTDGNSGKITYVAPTFYGLTVGASFAPDANKAGSNSTPQANYTGTHWGVGARYQGEFEGVGVAASVGYVNIARRTGVQSSVPGNYVQYNQNEVSSGLNLSYAGFTFGGGYRWIDRPLFAGASQDPQATPTGTSWSLGASYQTGPYGVSLGYFQSKAEGTRQVNEDDTLKTWELSGEYSLGPGVTWQGTFAHVNYDSESAAAISNNKGWAVVTGLDLRF